LYYWRWTQSTANSSQLNSLFSGKIQGIFAIYQATSWYLAIFTQNAYNQKSINREALVKALNWNEALMCSTVSSMNALAKREGVTQRYIAHLLKLAYLAPDIMEAITRGDIPSSISLGRLKKGFPLNWQEQRKVLGFSA
jgi:hypothetical protein